eukprot:20456-Ditylum_brightwellii.AAC.1
MKEGAAIASALSIALCVMNCFMLSAHGGDQEMEMNLERDFIQGNIALASSQNLEHAIWNLVGSLMGQE